MKWKHLQLQCFFWNGWAKRCCFMCSVACFREIYSFRRQRGAPFLCGAANYKCRCSRDVKIVFDSTELQWKYDCYSSVKCAGFHDKNDQLRCSFCYSCCFVAFATRFKIEQMNSIFCRLFYYFCRRFHHLFKFVRHTAHWFLLLVSCSLYEVKKLCPEEAHLNRWAKRRQKE